MRQEFGGHPCIATDDFAVELQRGRSVAQHLVRVVVAHDDALCRRHPQFRQQAAVTGRDTFPDFAFERECVLAQPLAGDAAWRDVQQHLVDNPGERSGRDGAAAPGDQHQGKVVAQQREIPVPGEECRAQSESVDRLHTFGLQSASRKEHPLFVECGGHVHVGSL